MTTKQTFYEGIIGKKNLTELLEDSDKEKKIEFKVIQENLPEKYQHQTVSNSEVTKSLASDALHGSWNFIKKIGNLGRFTYACPTYSRGEDDVKFDFEGYFFVSFCTLVIHNAWYSSMIGISDSLNYDNPYTIAGAFIPIATNTISGAYEIFRNRKLKLKEQKKLKLKEK